jgi:taurine dioxygenase
MALSTETEVTSGVCGGPAHVVPTGAALGATVRGVDLKDLEDVAFARIMHRTQVNGDARPV